MRQLFRRLFNRRLGWFLLWTALIAVVAISINLIGIHVVGDVSEWNRWLKRHGGYFLAWRLCLYAGTVYGWLRMRQRLVNQEAGPAAAGRLRRAEIAAVLAVITLEGTAALQSR